MKLNTPQESRIQVKVKPGARKTELLKEEKDVLHIAVAAPPEGGKANKELEKFLTKHTGKNATVKSGFTSRHKVILLREKR